jgi:hypothetical protein
MTKPLDCTGTPGPIGKHDFRAHDTVHCVESGEVTPPIVRSPEQHLQFVVSMLKRGKANNGKIHLLEIEQALECLAEAEEAMRRFASIGGEET